MSFLDPPPNIVSDPDTRLISDPNAYLQFYDPNTGSYHKRNIWVDLIAQPHNMSGHTAQTLWFQHFYAKSYAPNPVQVQGRVPTQKHYDSLADHIRFHHGLLAQERGNTNLAGKGQGSGALDPFQLMLMKFEVLKNPQPPHYPSKEDFTVWGWVNSFPAGAKRFNPAPPFTFEFEVIFDNQTKVIGHEWISRAINNWFFDGLDNFPGGYSDEVEAGFPEGTDNTDINPIGSGFQH